MVYIKSFLSASRFYILKLNFVLIMFSDAHMSFIKDWDDEIVSQFFSARNEMAILSAYPVRIKRYLRIVVVYLMFFY